MASIAKAYVGSVQTEAHAYSARMEEARSRIEQRFLDGGGVLLSVLDILNKMIASMDGLTGSLDEDAARATMDELTATAAALSALTQNEASRQVRFREIAATERMVRPHVTSMQETMRYLRTFAVTAKITGAGIADFAGFAEEILQRIQEGSNQVNGFSDRLAELGTSIGPAIVKGEQTVQRYGQIVPKIVSELSADIDQLNKQRQILGQRADQVKSIARNVQNKLASVLSSMQIGDITRQRIEHCQSSFDVLRDYLGSPESEELTAEQRHRLTQLVTHLVSEQLEQSRADFDRDTGKIVETIASFRSELMEITQIQQSMSRGNDETDAFGMRALESGVADAREAVFEIEKVAGVADEMTQRTLGTVQSLLDGIGLVQVVRGDIHYMALNTNLRCGKIGEEGKAINVVTAELRVFAGRLDEVAEQVVGELKGLEEAAQKLLGGSQKAADVDSLDARLERALGNIRAVGDAMEADLVRIRSEGQSGIDQMNQALARLDFQAELGEVLRRCADDIRPTASEEIDSSDLHTAIAVIGPRINRLYTMASERELHAAILGTDAPEEAPLTVLSDDDLEAALF